MIFDYVSDVSDTDASKPKDAVSCRLFRSLLMHWMQAIHLYLLAPCELHFLPTYFLIVLCQPRMGARKGKPALQNSLGMRGCRCPSQSYCVFYRSNAEAMAIGKSSALSVTLRYCSHIVWASLKIITDRQARMFALGSSYQYNTRGTFSNFYILLPAHFVLIGIYSGIARFPWISCLRGEANSMAKSFINHEYVHIWSLKTPKAK